MTLSPTERLGIIEEWNATDSVGRVRLDDGSRMRLGGSACRGFRPMDGLRVRVLGEAPHPLGGLRATAVELVDGAAYDALVQAEEPEPDDAASTGNAFTLGWLVILLPTAPGPGRAGARALVERAGLAQIGARVELGPGREVGLGGFGFPLYLGRSPLLQEVPHAGFVALSGGLVGLEIGARQMRGAYASDPFAPDGKLRALLRVGAAFARVGNYVWRPVSGGAVPADFFLDEVGDLDDPSNRPIDALIDVVPGEGAMRTAGLALAGLPDVIARGGDEQDEALREAARFMTRENRALRPGDRIASEGAMYELVGEREGLLEIARAPG